MQLYALQNMLHTLHDAFYMLRKRKHSQTVIEQEMLWKQKPTWSVSKVVSSSSTLSVAFLSLREWRIEHFLFLL